MSRVICVRVDEEVFPLREAKAPPRSSGRGNGMVHSTLMLCTRRLRLGNLLLNQC